MVGIDQNTEKCPRNLRRLTVTLTPVKDQPILACKHLKEYNNNNNNNNNNNKKKKKKKKKKLKVYRHNRK